MMSLAPVFIPIPGIGSAVHGFLVDLTPLESLLFTNRNRAESTIAD